jgi:hypothetical protein
LLAIGIHNEPDASVLQIIVNFLIVDHLAQQKNPSTPIFFQCSVADLDGIFDAVTKSEMAGEIKNNRTKIENGGGEILLPQIFYAS